MVVTVQRQRPLGAGAEQCAVFWRIGDNFGRPFTTDMSVEAQHTVRGGHNHVQIMAHHQYGTAAGAAHGLDLSVKTCGTGLVQPLCRFVKDQDIGRLQQRARQQHPLELASRQGGKLVLPQLRHACILQRSLRGLRADPVGQIEEPRHGERERCVNREGLRHVADAQSFGAPHTACCRAHGPDKRTQQRGFAGPVGTNDRYNLAARHMDVHIAQDRAPAVSKPQAVCFDQGIHAVACCAHSEHSPVASTTVCSMTKPAVRAASPSRPSAGAVLASATV